MKAKKPPADKDVTYVLRRDGQYGQVCSIDRSSGLVWAVFREVRGDGTISYGEQPVELRECELLTLGDVILRSQLMGSGA